MQMLNSSQAMAALRTHACENAQTLVMSSIL